MKCVYCGKADVDGVDRCPMCGKAKDGFMSRLISFLRGSMERREPQTGATEQGYGGNYGRPENFPSNKPARDEYSGFSHDKPRTENRQAEQGGPAAPEAPFRMTVRQVNEVPGIGWGATGLVEGGAVLLGQQVALTTAGGRRTELMVEGILIGNNVEEIVAPGTEATLFFTKLNEPIQPGDTLSDL